MSAVACTCPKCGQPVPADAPAGLCPRCLVAGGFSGTQLADTTDEEADAQATLHIVIPEDAALPSGVPRKLGKYELLEEVARGGMGIVYKARHTGLDAIVAVKLIRSGVLATPTDVERFQREARAAAKLQHPNIVSVHDIGEQDGQHYFSMDYVPGANLAELARTRPFSPKQAAEITRAVALAIHYAHGQGVLHRDIKPSNVILTPEQVPRVLDFGLARIATDDSQLTQSGTPMGSPCYMPPEQCGLQRKAEGGRQKAEIRSTGEALSQRSNETRPSGIGDRESRVGPWSDVYGLGAMLYELLTGRPPFHAPTAVETLRLVLESDPVLPRMFNRTLPTDLETICLKCLEKEPHKRYASAQDLADELERFLADKPIRARRVTQAERAWRWCRRNPRVASLTAATVALLLAVAIGSPIAAYRINRERLRAERNLYAAEMAAAFQAMAGNNLGRAKQLLRKYQSEPRLRRFRGWEWRHLWGRCRSDELTTLGRFPRAVGSVAFSADGTRLVAVCEDGTFRVWETGSRQLVATNRPRGHICLSRGGRWLVDLDREHNVRLSEVTTLQEVTVVRIHTNEIQSVALSANGETIATIGGDVLRLWNLKERREILRREVRQSWSMALSPDGANVAIGTTDWKVYLLDTLTQSERIVQQLGKPGVSLDSRLTFSDDGTKLASAALGLPVTIWEVATGQLVRELPTDNARVDGLAFSPDGNQLATTGADQRLRLWDLSTGQRIATYQGHEHEVWTVAFSPDGKTLATGGKDKTVRLWSVDHKPDSHISRASLQAIDDFNRDSSVVSLDGKTVLTVNTNATYSLWDTTSLRQTIDRALPLTNFMAAAVGSGGRLAALGNEQGAVLLIDPRTGSLVADLEGRAQRVCRLAFSWDAKFLAAGRSGGWVDVWDVATTRRVLTLENSTEGPCWALGFPRDSRLLCAGYEGGLGELWDLTSRQKVAVLAGPDRHFEAVTDFAFSSDGNKVVTSSLDATFKMWNARTGALEATLGGQLLGYTSVALSPDGQRIVTAGADGQVQVWDAVTRQELATLNATHRSGGRRLAFSPDGNTLVWTTASELVVWRAPSFGEIDTAEATNQP